jgi:6-pyruvoyltetrahydropterin/6-carboxytetrahydropterin synthase
MQAASTPIHSPPAHCTLRRSVRVCFSTSPHGSDASITTAKAGKNGYAGFPRLASLGAYTQFDVAVQGSPDAKTGYLLDIHVIDKAMHAAIEHAQVRNAYISGQHPAHVLPALLQSLFAHLPTTHSLRWHVTPFCSYEASMSHPSRVVLRQRFDFAAAHRLHARDLSDEQNRATFGKCNNPRGHGHNYQFEPAVRIEPTSNGTNFSLLDLEVLCDSVLLAKFDHTYLNVDTQEFNQALGGLNPSVENIASVFFRLLAPAVAAKGATLESMTVWETDRTCATVSS